MRSILGYLVCISMLVGASFAKAEVITIGENSGWSVTFDATSSACLATPRGSEGIYYFQKSLDDLVLLFGGPKLNWVEADKPYPTVVRTDRRRWNGVLHGFRGPRASGLALANPAGEFLRAIRGASTMSLEADGATYGPYSLTGSNQTMSWLEECIKRRDSGGFQPERPIYLEPNTLMSWSEEHFDKTFSADGWTAKIAKQDNLDDTSTVYLKVSRDGKELGTLKAEGKPNGGYGQIGVYTLESGRKSIVFTSFTGGAHCCTQTVIGKVDENFMREVEVGMHDGDGITLEDIDQDGTFELVTVDQRMLYGFDAYAASMPPVVISRLVGDKVETVTRQPQYQAYLRQSLVRSLNQLERGTGEITDGQAAGLLAEASNVGMYKGAREFLSDRVLGREPGAIAARCGDPDCPQERTFSTLGEAIAVKFEKWGYKTSSSMEADALEFAKKLASAKGFGAADDTRETSCKEIPITFKVDSDNVLSMGGYEMSCRFEQAAMAGSGLLAIGLCTGEGEHWTRNYLIHRDDSGLSIRDWDRDLSELLASPKVDPIKECK